ncbi:MAG: hypothetical protein NWQ53_01745, partial [Flavobacteriales bacterium]|nr:hypothetical protein [Flavobacteriales bacterium]
FKDINNAKPARQNNRNNDNSRKNGFGETEEEEEEEKAKIDPVKSIARLLMMVRNVSGSYTRNEGILLPGYD